MIDIAPPAIDMNRAVAPSGSLPQNADQHSGPIDFGVVLAKTQAEAVTAEVVGTASGPDGDSANQAQAVVVTTGAVRGPRPDVGPAEPRSQLPTAFDDDVLKALVSASPAAEPDAAEGQQAAAEPDALRAAADTPADKGPSAGTAHLEIPRGTVLPALLPPSSVDLPLEARVDTDTGPETPAQPVRLRLRAGGRAREDGPSHELVSQSAAGAMPLAMTAPADDGVPALPPPTPRADEDSAGAPVMPKGVTSAPEQPQSAAPVAPQDQSGGSPVSPDFGLAKMAGPVPVDAPASEPLGAHDNALAQAGQTSGVTDATASVKPGHAAHALGLAITRAQREGRDILSVQLEPAELGRVEVRLAFGDRGDVSAVITTEQPAALALLRRDTADLVRALTQGGLSADAGAFRFEQRGQGQDRPAHRSPRGPVFAAPEKLPAMVPLAGNRLDLIA